MHLPIGVSNFRRLVNYKSPISGKGYLFVDKTLLVREILDDLTEVIVITRPRRFGKTLNLSMLHHFFADVVDGESTTNLFDGLKISKHKDCMKCQGKHPVIFLPLKDTKADSFESAINKIYEQIRQAYEQHRYVVEDNKLSKEEKEAFLSILNETANLDKLSFAVHNLSYYIHKTLGQKVYIFIDEYDTPIQSAYLNGYYDKFISFIKGLLGSALKGNANLRQAILTGILRVSKESLFSDLNNVKIYSILKSKYSNYFGFTEEEVNNILKKANLPSTAVQTKEWYNGYNFGETTVYNPWSIIEFINENGQLGAYWVNTSSNELIKNLVINADPSIKEKLRKLISNETIQEFVDEHVAFNDLQKNHTALWSLLLASGYLKFVSKKLEGQYYICDLKVPNKEVESFFNVIIQEWLSGSRGFQWYKEFLHDLSEGSVLAFEDKLQTLINDTLSFRDVTKASQEAFYHGLMLAFVSGLKETHEIKSNKESGKGFYDVALIPKNTSSIGILMEFKATEKEENLKIESKKALEQINKTEYIAELQQKGIEKICKMGIAFSGKNVLITSK